MTRVILMHGKDTDPADKWYPWFIDALQKQSIQVYAPFLPKSADPVMDEWLAELDKLVPDEETILIGHSRGGVAVMRWLEKLSPGCKVKKVILVAANSGLLADKAIPSESNYGFYTEEGYDFEKIKSHCDDFVVFHSKEDPWVPFSAGEKNTAGLSARFLVFEDKLHFGKNLSEFPELLEEIST